MRISIRAYFCDNIMRSY